jgi:hypothetical protein
VLVVITPDISRGEHHRRLQMQRGAAGLLRSECCGVCPLPKYVICSPPMPALADFTSQLGGEQQGVCCCLAWCNLVFQNVYRCDLQHVVKFARSMWLGEGPFGSSQLQLLPHR